MRTSDRYQADIRSLAGATLAIVQPSIWKSVHELRSGDTSVGTLTFTSFFGHTATGECADGSWNLRQTGIWKPKLVVEDAGSRKTLVEVPLSLFRRTFTFTLRDRSHETITLEHNFLASKFTLTGRMGHELARLEPKVFSLTRASLHLSERAGAYDELPWMIFALWFVAATVRRRNQHVHTS